MPHQSCKIGCVYKTPFRKSGHIYISNMSEYEVILQIPVFFHIIIFSQASSDYQHTERRTQFFTLSCYFFKMDLVFLQYIAMQKFNKIYRWLLTVNCMHDVILHDT